MALMGVAVWLAGLTLILVLKNNAERKGRGQAWVPLTVYLALSAVAIVVAGLFYRHSELKSRRGGSVGASSLMELPKPTPSPKPVAGKAGASQKATGGVMAKPPPPKPESPAVRFNDSSLDSDPWLGGGGGEDSSADASSP